MIKPVKRLIDRVRSSHSVLLERGGGKQKVKQTLDVSAFLLFLFLPPPLPSPPLPRSYNLSQECFNFRDRFSLSNQAGQPVVHMMRCDGCKTIKRGVGDGREQRRKERSLLDRFNYTE